MISILPLVTLFGAHSFVLYVEDSGSETGIVDIFNGNSRSWSTASLTGGRTYIGATSLSSEGLVFFAGGNSGFVRIVLAVRYMYMYTCIPDDLLLIPDVAAALIDIFNASSGSWSTGTLSTSTSALTATSVEGFSSLFSGVALFAGGGCKLMFILCIIMIQRHCSTRNLGQYFEFAFTTPFTIL